MNGYRLLQPGWERLDVVVSGDDNDRPWPGLIEVNSESELDRGGRAVAVAQAQSAHPELVLFVDVLFGCGLFS